MNDREKIAAIEAELVSPQSLFALETDTVLGEELQVFKNRARSLRQLLDIAQNYGPREYLVFEDERWTFEAHAGAVASLASELSSRGVGKGDRVAILAANRVEWIVTFWATVSLGAVVVGLNGWWVRDEIEYAPRRLLSEAARWR